MAIMASPVVVSKYSHLDRRRELVMISISLTRNQVHQLADLAEKFSDIEWFTIDASDTSGIGPTVLVKFLIFKNDHRDFDTTVDITDYSTW